MRLAIDASATKTGGAFTHLVEVLTRVNPAKHGFKEIHIWAPNILLDALPSTSWLIKHHNSVLEKGWLKRAWWQSQSLGKEIRTFNCDLLWVIGGSFATDFRPVVTMSQNLLPFDWRELMRLDLVRKIKALMLRQTQSRSFRNAEGIIFLTDYARERITKVTGPLDGKSTVIPHGIGEHFFHKPDRNWREDKNSNPTQLIYVSNIDEYKHQWNVAEAVSDLHDSGYSVEVKFVGPPFKRPYTRLKEKMNELDPEGHILKYSGVVPNKELPKLLLKADIAIFASTCENLPVTLLEYMAAGMPIACTHKRPMTDVLGESGEYFDPEDTGSIACALTRLIEDTNMRKRYALEAYEKSCYYSWQRCADSTFEFLTGTYF